MSYILLNDNNEKFIKNNVNIDKILLLNEKNNIQHMYKVKKKVEKGQIHNVSYFKCYTNINLLREELSDLLYSLGLSKTLHFHNFFELKIDNLSSFYLNINRFINL